MDSIVKENILPKAELCQDYNLPIAKIEIIRYKKNPRILIRNESNILPASVYKKNNNLTHDIEIIDSNTKKEKGDIYYNFF